MQILIVDDDSRKIGNIKRAIEEVLHNDGSIDYCLDINEARDKLSITMYDLLILDIQLPFKITDTTVQTNGGVELLNEIRSVTGLYLPEHIIGITSFDEAHNDHQEDFAQALWPILKYQPGMQSWRDQLKEKIIYIAEVIKQKNNLATVEKYEFDLAIITAVKIEHDAVLALPVKWEKMSVLHDSTEYWVCEIERESKKLKLVHASQHQMGMTAAATLSMKLISNFRPRYLAMAGILAGYDPTQINFGDIIVAAESWDFGSGKIKESNENKYKFDPDPHQYNIEVELKEMLMLDYAPLLSEIYNSCKLNKPQTIISLHVGPVASGAAVIQNQGYVDDYIKRYNRKLLGIDMETYGVYYAAKNAKKPRPTVISIKSVCDFADARKNDDYQGYAAFTSAQFVFYFAINKLL